MVRRDLGDVSLARDAMGTTDPQLESTALALPEDRQQMVAVHQVPPDKNPVLVYHGPPAPPAAVPRAGSACGTTGRELGSAILIVVDPQK
jgi:hypothetical protein